MNFKYYIELYFRSNIRPAVTLVAILAAIGFPAPVHSSEQIDFSDSRGSGIQFPNIDDIQPPRSVNKKPLVLLLEAKNEVGFGVSQEGVESVPIPLSRPDVNAVEPLAGPFPALNPRITGLDEQADADTQQTLQQIASHPEAGPLWKCFSEGFQEAVGVIARNSDSEPDYYLGIIGLGGFSSIGDRVRLSCDTHLISDLNGRPMSPVAQKTNDLFLLVLVAQDREFFETCASKTGAEWVGLKRLCSLQSEKFESRLK